MELEVWTAPKYFRTHPAVVNSLVVRVLMGSLSTLVTAPRITHIRLLRLVPALEILVFDDFEGDLRTSALLRGWDLPEAPEALVFLERCHPIVLLNVP